MKILVWLSWWVDSAVAAYLLKQQWHEVVWWFMKNYLDEENPNCTTRQDSEVAIKVAKFLGIEILAFDFIQEYEDRIIKYIYDGYKKGITPNPDILCNNLVKFDLFLEEALKLGFDKVATGHYARIGCDDEIYKLLRWVDYNKDQSYFLSGLNQYQLSKAIFPIGELDKNEVRKIAKEIWLPNADRKDSQGLCFVWNIPMKEFLKKRLPEKKWDILLEDWEKVGEHNWAYFFTIWQSRWLDINIKAYVVWVDVDENIVYVSYDRNVESLEKKRIEINDLHWIWETIAPLTKGGTGGSKYISYNPKLKEKARELRNNQTKAEKKIWYEFLSTYNYKFQRQKPIDSYIVDFFCNSLKLVIEVDWDTHWSKSEIEYDKTRTKKLESLWFKVIRIKNDDVYNNFSAVCEKIMLVVEEILSGWGWTQPPLPPLQRGAIQESLEKNRDVCLKSLQDTPLSAKIRYRQEPQEWILVYKDNKIFFEFNEKVWGVAPGQSLVIYNLDECLGGGVIV